MKHNQLTVFNESAPRRILIASPYIFGVGGVAVAVSCLSRELSDRGYAVTHLCRGPSILIKRADSETAHPTYSVQFRHPVATLKSWIGFWLLLPVICTNTACFLVRHKVDNVLIQYPVPGLLPLAVACRLLGVKLCITFQGSDAHGLHRLSFAESAIIKCLLKLANTVTAVSGSLAEKVAAFLPSLRGISIAVIPNGTPAAIPSAVRTSSDARKLRVTAVGRLIPRKGFDVFLRSIALLRAEANLLDCRIIGEGPEFEKLGNLIRQLHVGEMVKLVGSMDHASVMEQLQASDLFVLSSHAEGAALVLAEAMSSGCAIVSTAVDGALEIIESGKNGLLVAPDNPEQLAAAIRQLLLDSEFRYKIAANGLASSRELLWDRITDRYIRVIGGDSDSISPCCLVNSANLAEPSIK